MSDGTQARPDSISDFGMKTVEQTKDIGDGFSRHASDVMGANVGASGLDMGTYFRGSYANHAEALAAFIADAGDGLMSLGYAGVTVAQVYRDGDADQQAGMDGVNTAFNPAAGSPSLQRDRRQAQQQAADAGPATGGQPTTWTPPAPTGPMVCTPHGTVPAGSSDDGEPTPFEEVDALGEDLGNAEEEFDAAEEADETRAAVEGDADDVLLAPGAPSTSSTPSPATA